MKTIRLLAFIASGASYLLVVLGGWVRITGSGMGCGDHWPLCNGHIIPPLDDVATFIEWAHRLVALGVSILVVGVAVAALLRRETPGVAGPRGPLRPALLAVALLVVQVLLGAVTVWLELPAAAVILHLGAAMAMLAVLLVVGLRAGAHQPAAVPAGGRRLWRSALGAAGLAAVAVLLGGLTANAGAGGACLGFPLCSGEIFPSGGLAQIQWLHRLVAYALTLHLIGVVAQTVRRKSAPAIQRSAMVALAITVIQIVVGAAMILSLLQPHWRATHVAAGTAVWMALVVFAWFTRPAPGAPAP
jgi:cytochrome c oxidase assembly protein subunit 15